MVYDQYVCDPDMKSSSQNPFMRIITGLPLPPVRGIPVVSKFENGFELPLELIENILVPKPSDITL